MAPLAKALKEILRCPRCRGDVEEEGGGRTLRCPKCQLTYPVRDGIPQMVVEEAIPTGDGSKPEAIKQMSFKVSAGPEQGMAFQLDTGTCRAIGRASQDAQRTSVFNMDLTLSLDEGTKVLILRYITRQFGDAESGQGMLGGFRRVADIVLTDLSLTRLHAMFFASQDKVGILDLVSKNGTFVNGQEVESCFLRPGDIVELGETKIVFEG